MTQTLKTERNTVAMGKRILRAAYELRLGRRGDLESVFEHGQWWITSRSTGAQWSACDAEGYPAQGVADGFCFEQVTKGDSEKLPQMTCHKFRDRAEEKGEV